MNLTELASATALHATQYPRAAYLGPRELLASKTIEGLPAGDFTLTRSEHRAVRRWRDLDEGVPGMDCPVRWDGDLGAAWRRWSSTQFEYHQELYRSIIGRVPPGHGYDRLAAVLWLVNAAAADFTARRAAG